MRLLASDDLRALLDRQCGVVSRSQALRTGVSPTVIDNQLRCGRWQRLQHGVYATFTGTPDREAVLWAAVLRAGPQAALSHRTAAELHGLVSEPARLVHITVPATQRIAPFRGALLHHSRAFFDRVQPGSSPPRFRMQDTVLDLTQSSVEDAFNWLCRAIGRGLTTSEHLSAAMAERSRVRWRAELLLALGDLTAGVRSSLERRYVTGVEPPHNLPEADRQVQTVIEGRTRYVDNLYKQAMLAVELDGRAAHPPEQRWADSRRDNAHAMMGVLTLRYNWSDVTSRPCLVAAEVGALLNLRGPAVQLRTCGPACPVLGRATMAAS